MSEVFRDELRQSMSDSSRNIGASNSLVAECWVIRDDQTLAKQLGFQYVHVGADVYMHINSSLKRAIQT